ncbi:MAG: twin-arginine translocase TatA/TatE family subunit [Candidatus Marinimicrobia bacterium]|nr:twin-arginine translocase TatA/TatE family subunit [Candidatus Neomarinimicrobiota bacterium]MCF7829708.1 twin-arginine translocase TatA/TatE family subunit [Candidatus Neomarinimicrobiota bacterium]MCF7881658.1 twin-arginine translocase TatA/TatE family subunit [Candidatus Neomarinimicrobiota bacterium]
MGSLGPTELIIILAIILLLFGSKKLPELARGLGRGIREFKDATNEITEEIKNAEPSQTKRELNRDEKESEPSQEEDAEKTSGSNE